MEASAQNQPDRESPVPVLVTLLSQVFLVLVVVVAVAGDDEADVGVGAVERGEGAIERFAVVGLDVAADGLGVRPRR